MRIPRFLHNSVMHRIDTRNTMDMFPTYFIILLAALGLLNGVVTADEDDSVFENVCSAVGAAFDLLEESCSKTISIPTGAEVVYKEVCNNNCCDWDCGQCTNNCCTWSCGNPLGIPCSGCSAKHCGQTCVPCTGCSLQHCGETCIDVPDTLRLTTEDISICDLAGAAIPGIDAIAQATEWCPCISHVIEYLGEGLTDKIDNGEYNEATTAALGALGALVDCIADRSTSITSEKDDIIDEAESKEGIVLWAPELGLEQYTQLLGAIILCAKGGKCEDIAVVFKDIFVKTAAMIGEGLFDELREHYVGKIFDPILGVVDSMTSLKESFSEAKASLLDEIDSCATSLANDAEQDLKDLVATYNQAYDEVTNTVDLVVDVGTKVSDAFEAVEDALDAIETAVDSLDTSFAEQVVNAIKSGEKPAVYEAVKFLAEADSIGAVEDGAKSVFTFVESLEQHFNDMKEKATALTEAVLSIEGFENCDLDTNAVADMEDLVADLEKEVSDALKEIEEVLKNPIDEIVLDPDVASYSSEWTIEITDLPCSELVSETFTNDLCPVCDPITVDVPKFYACSYSTKIPLPKEHTPYLRLIFPK